MVIGIVGHAADKFTAVSEERAREALRSIIERHNRPKVVSGQCHLGGIDIWAIEEAERMGCDTQEFPPKEHNWTFGYQPRNLQIVKASDKVYSLVVDNYPPGFAGRKWADYCYHCERRDHIKSGGCWTAKQAVRRGKLGQIVIIEQER